jgi:phosphatidylinositol alpha-1,6-mannosyltransferase
MSNKTLVLTENFPPLSGGSGRWFWELYSRLPKEDYLIVADDTPEGRDFDKSHDLNIIRIPLKSTEWGLKSLKGLKFYYSCFKALRQVIKDHNITKIHTGRVIHEGVTAWLLSLFYKIKYVCYVHGEDVETAATSREHNFMVQRVCNRAQYLVCNSNNSATILKRLGYAHDNKIRVMHPGVDAEQFYPVEEDPKFKKSKGWMNKKVIITVGRLQQRKGQDMMIKAMPLILEEHPNTMYAIIGRGECKSQLKELIVELNLDENVQLLDEISDSEMIKCYQQCDLFILPNRTIENDIEGFGMVLAEAQACAKPVIAGDSGGTKETMVINETGYVIDCTSKENIANKLNELLHDIPSLVNTGKLGREHILRKLDWKALTVQAKQIFSE